MADPVVLKSFEDRIVAASIPYFDTINQRTSVHHIPNEWVTFEEELATVVRVSLGQTNPRWRETGALFAVISVKSGTGKKRANDLANEIRDLFWEYTDEFIRVTSVDSDRIYQPEEGNFFQVRVPINYEFDFTR